MSPVRLAATVILARPKFELYLTRRSSHSPFAPNAFVFPGGTIDPQDAGEESQGRTIGLDPDRLGREFRATVSPELVCTEPPIGVGEARGLLVAAIRELFEEAGILLACSRAGESIVLRRDDWSEIAAERIRVRHGDISFADFLKARDWYADARALTLFSHWITPTSEPRRYNTHFFFAEAPSDQAAFADAVETYDGVWMSPREALERYNADDIHLVYPTVKHLQRLATFDSLAAAAEFARSKAVITIMPRDTGDDFELPGGLEAAW